MPLSGSYPSNEIHEQSKALFKRVRTKYIGVEGDAVYSGMPFLRTLGIGMIGNNPNAVPNKAQISILEAHSEANQNINNLNFIYDKNNKDSAGEWRNTLDILNKIHQNGIRSFNVIEEDK
ncbi:hypothetical protein HPC38_09385 [Pasteurellaceae bacterium HPA106]|uniref:hypothetical protein n=1 Tax=Spirabiliibacterium pneumoniae TaxID=221400 RepID=UPI001AADBC16|nr:hypothetical protein [Spirabiliibacterium pneumoniae]MBE2897082.1 hypothetical protein [Spirabiliibacterium pneumoniae]